MPSAVAAPRARKSRPGQARATRAQPRRNGKLVSRLTRKLIEKIGANVAAGYTLDGAAAHAGVPPRTFFGWCARGRNGSGTPLERELVLVVDMELARTKATGARRVWEDEDWRAVAWYLERRWPDEFGPPERRVQHGGHIGLYAAITPERLREALEAGDVTAEQAQTFAHVWRVLAGRDVTEQAVLSAGDVIEQEGT